MTQSFKTFRLKVQPRSPKGSSSNEELNPSGCSPYTPCSILNHLRQPILPLHHGTPSPCALTLSGQGAGRLGTVRESALAKKKK